MRIKILRRTTVAGQRVLPGDVVEAREADARYLMGMGKAKPAAEDPMPVALEPEPIEARRPRARKPIPV